MKDKESVWIKKAVAKTYSAVDRFSDNVADTLSECDYEIQECFDFDSCIAFYEESKKRLPAVAGFVLSVKRNEEPKNKKDKFLITQGLIDSKKKPVSKDGKTTLARVIHATDVDKKTIDYLDGDKIRIFTM